MSHGPSPAPLNALRAFEAAARHHSFTRAADELHVTQAAISHQVRQLEDWLGRKLFERQDHALTRTAAGKAYAPELSRLLDALASATERVAGNYHSLAGPLRITALPSFVARWLVPRLARFRAQHPGIDLHVTSEVALHDFARDEGFDIAIRLGLGRWPGLQADLVSPERLSPVCSPALLAQAPLATVADLQAHTLLHDQPGDLWPRWLALAGASRSDAEAIARTGPGFSDSALVLQAAAEGQGVLGRIFLASADITAGRLVKPFALDLPNDYSYWLAYPPAAAQQPRLAAFRDWVLAESSAWRNT
ncbi:transcriptional regulator GcvA [Acidovorax sp.]|uniref:transcriptional regulator GcvA n=1 Tax=Acidovorax sp. TaxID=1872122 RepID=UPI00391F1107